MNKPNSTTHSYKIFTFALGAVIMLLCVFDSGTKNNHVLSSMTANYDSVSEELTDKKGMIVNNYLLGLTIYKYKDKLDR